MLFHMFLQFGETFYFHFDCLEVGCKDATVKNTVNTHKNTTQQRNRRKNEDDGDDAGEPIHLMLMLSNW